jgi:malonyl-CoA O-methyltransferase
LVFLPGWGFDASIIELAPDYVKLPLSWLVPTGPIDPYTVVQDLKIFLEQHGIPKVDLVGWSMGSYTALEFARLFPDQTDRLLLLATRDHWPVGEIRQMHEALDAEPAECLRFFYRRCFLGNREAYREFCSRFEPRYLKTMDCALLHKGLDFLAAATVTHHISTEKVLMIHGNRDIVAPARAMIHLAGARTLVVEQAGHAIFLAPEFWQAAMRRKKFTIQERFSAAATTYDQHATVQKTSAQILLQKIPADFTATNILEIGCGTGHYTRQLAEKWPRARLLALDFSLDMLALARRHLEGINQVSLLCANGEQFLANSDSKFDLITSNACLQWFNAPQESFGHIARLLAPQRFMACSLFGPRSLEELSKAMETEMGHGFPLVAGSFPDLEAIQGWLARDFTAVECTETIVTREYASILDLLTHLKRTGTTGVHTPPVLTRARLRRLDRWFMESFGGCRVSYQLFMVRAQKG